jgi:hypothetical protein
MLILLSRKSRPAATPPLVVFVIVDGECLCFFFDLKNLKTAHPPLKTITMPTVDA